MSVPANETVETLVVNREVSTALKKLKQNLKILEKQVGAEKIVDWYRRLGKMSLAIKYLEKIQPKEKNISVLLARIYNILGYPHLAEKIFQSFKKETAQDHLYFAEFCLSIYKYDDAITSYLKFFSIKEKTYDHEYRLALFGLADSYAGINDFDIANKLVNEALLYSQENIMQAIGYSCLGEYQARQTNHKAGLQYFEKSLSLMPSGEAFGDLGLLYKWQAVCLAHLGFNDTAEDLFFLAINLIKEAGYRSDGWLAILFERHNAGLGTWQEFARLCHYPGTTKTFGQKFKVEKVPLNLGDSKNAKIVIDLSASEFKVDDRIKFGLSKDLTCLAYLRIGENWGISYSSIISQLWSDEPHDIFSLEKRLEQLFTRIKNKYGLVIYTKHRVAYLHESCLKQISVLAGGPSLPSLLRKQKNGVTIKDIENYYNVSSTTAKRLYKKWNLSDS
ncbi:MAG: hypothetical protein ACOYOK_05155 [Pseudobdellovibrionaceae bacterium]